MVITFISGVVVGMLLLMGVLLSGPKAPEVAPPAPPAAPPAPVAGEDLAAELRATRKALTAAEKRAAKAEDVVAGLQAELQVSCQRVGDLAFRLRQAQGLALTVAQAASTPEEEFEALDAAFVAAREAELRARAAWNESRSWEDWDLYTEATVRRREAFDRLMAF